jgi:flagellar basal-body rod modification protein FlgD
MAAMAGLVHHTMAGRAMTAGQALTGAGASPAAVTGNASSSTGSSSSSATISANDFLSLLVTEMQNQDPTADSDPNEYINQLVQVNSLEQLIDINQNLSTALGGAGTTPASQTSRTAGHPAPTEGAAGMAATAGRPGTAAAGSGVSAAISRFAGSPMAKSQGGGPPMAQVSHAGHAPGNLSVPEDHASAHKVAHALAGRPHAATPAGKARGQ